MIIEILFFFCQIIPNDDDNKPMIPAKKATKDKWLFKSVTITSAAPKKPRIIPPHCNLDKFSFK